VGEFTCFFIFFLALTPIYPVKCPVKDNRHALFILSPIINIIGDVEPMKTLGFYSLTTITWQRILIYFRRVIFLTPITRWLYFLVFDQIYLLISLWITIFVYF